MKRPSYLTLTIIIFVLGLTVSGCMGPSGDEKKSVKVLVNGSPIHGANGVMFDDKDMLLE